jgi:hypothetical protein
LTSAAQVVLDADITSQVTLVLPGIVVNRGSNICGQPDGGTSGALTVNENFQGASTLTTFTSATGTVSQTDTTRFYTNPFLPATTRSALCTAVALNDTAGLVKSNALTGVTDGQFVDIEAWFWLNAASITAIVTIMQVQSNVSLAIQTTSNGGALQLTTSSDSHIYWQHPYNFVAVPLQSWVGIKMRIYKHATQGWVKVWQMTQDGPQRLMKEVLYVRDVNTKPASWANPRWGLCAGAQAGLTANVANALCSINFDCDLPGGLVLGNAGQTVLPDMLRS